MKVSRQNLLYAIRHPIRALRYFHSRDTIPLQVISKWLPTDPIILEAGAHNGCNTVEMAAFWPNSTIYAFEPVPSAFRELKQRTQLLDNRVFCFPKALGPKSGPFTMHLSGDGNSSNCQSSSLLRPTKGHHTEYSFVEFSKNVEVEVTTLDEWAAESKVKKLDFLRLDMQGYELNALLGASRILSAVRAVQLEISNIALYEGGPLYPEVKSKMADYGFKVADEAFFRVGGNVLFVQR